MISTSKFLSWEKKFVCQTVPMFWFIFLFSTQSAYESREAKRWTLVLYQYIFLKNFVLATQSCLMIRKLNQQILCKGQICSSPCVHQAQLAYPAHCNFILELVLELTNFKYVLFRLPFCKRYVHFWLNLLLNAKPKLQALNDL